MNPGISLASQSDCAERRSRSSRASTVSTDLPSRAASAEDARPENRYSSPGEGPHAGSPRGGDGRFAESCRRHRAWRAEHRGVESASDLSRAQGASCRSVCGLCSRKASESKVKGGGPMQLLPTTVRSEALHAMENELRTEAQLLTAAVGLVEACIECLARFSSENTLGNFFLIILVKSKHFSRGCLTLALEGLAQEAGALLRLWVEAIELIRYLAEDTSRVQEIIEERLPSPGERAKRISGDFQNLRKHLNENASHFAFTRASF